GGQRRPLPGDVPPAPRGGARAAPDRPQEVRPRQMGGALHRVVPSNAPRGRGGVRFQGGAAPAFFCFRDWGVIGSKAGGQTAAVLYTMVGTCKHLGIDPFAYLKETLPGLFALGEKPEAEQLVEWLPDRWLVRRQRQGPAQAAG